MKDFEKRIARLEQIAEKMRDPDMPLEQAFRLFEEGVTLAKELRKELDELQGKVEILLNSLEEGEELSTEAPHTADFEALNNEEQSDSEQKS
jgi:exodeoxyribonuclease VII small subunit